MSLVVVCQTPLHFLLAAILVREKSCKAFFVFIEESDVDEYFVKGVIDNVGEGLFRLPGSSLASGKLGRFIQKVRNIRALKACPALQGVTELLVFNDTTPESQYLIDVVYKAHGSVFLGEDGVATYEIGGVINVGVVNRIIGKFLFGLWWKPQNKIGLNPKIKIAYASRPDNLREDVSVHKEVRCIPLLDSKFFSEFENVPGLSLVSGSVLCILPLISSIGVEVALEFIRELSSGEGKVAIKFHPRELESNISEVLDGSLSKVVGVAPKNLPAELLCINAKEGGAVVGCRSSALHIVATLMPTADISFYEPSNLQVGVRWRNFYKSMGVAEYSARE